MSSLAWSYDARVVHKVTIAPRGRAGYAVMLLVNEAAHENELRLAVPSCHGRR